MYKMMIFLMNFCSETDEPIFSKFYMELSVIDIESLFNCLSSSEQRAETHKNLLLKNQDSFEADYEYIGI